MEALISQPEKFSEIVFHPLISSFASKFVNTYCCRRAFFDRSERRLRIAISKFLSYVTCLNLTFIAVKRKYYNAKDVFSSTFHLVIKKLNFSNQINHIVLFAMSFVVIPV